MKTKSARHGGSTALDSAFRVAAIHPSQNKEWLICFIHRAQLVWGMRSRKALPHCSVSRELCCGFWIGEYV